MSNAADIRNEDLILYIATKLKSNNSFGSIMLNKILYYADNIHYLKYGRAISSFQYVKQERGPTPAPSEFLPLRQKLIREGKLREEVTDKYIQTRKRLVPLKQCTTTFFSSEELAVIDSVIDDLKDKSAVELSDLSHCELGWLLTKIGEQIPYHAYLVSVPDLSENDFVWAESELSRLRPN